MSKHNLLDSVKMLQSTIDSSFRKLFISHQLNDLELKTLLIHVIGREDLNVENVCKAFSLTLDLLNALIKVNKENLEGHFSVNAKFYS